MGKVHWVHLGPSAAPCSTLPRIVSLLQTLHFVITWGLPSFCGWAEVSDLQTAPTASQSVVEQRLELWSCDNQSSALPTRHTCFPPVQERKGT